MIIPWAYQEEIADEGFAILLNEGLVYLNMEERTGKSLTSLLMSAKSKQVKKLLIITKKEPIEAWLELIKEWKNDLMIEVINYHSAHKAKIKPDLIILDEAHSYISGYPKPSMLWANVRKLTKGLPLIYLSATSHAQGTQLLFNQLKLSDFSPWSEFKNFYDWFQHYAIRDKKGLVKTIYIGPNRQAVDYSAVDHDKAWNDVKHLFITKTRAELGFEIEPEDKLHYIELNENTKSVYNTLITKLVIEFTHSETGKDYKIVCDTPIKLRWTLHMLEGGSIKITKKVVKNKEVKLEYEYLVLGSNEKVDYILANWGDTEDLVIMYNYKSELVKLGRFFKKAKLLQSTTFAEGIDLSMHKHLVIYSQDFSTSKHTQRRARQANKKRTDDITVHYLLVKKAISEQVYKTVSLNKTNFVDKTFEKEKL